MIENLTAKDVHVKAAQLRHSKWILDECTECDYKIGFIFNGDQVMYDSGCRCDTTANPITVSSWTSVLATIKSFMGTSREEEVRKFWNI